MVNEIDVRLLEQNKQEIYEAYDDIREILISYRTVIRPYIAFLELFDSEFPVEILNEVRAILQHLARCYYSEFAENKDDEEETEDLSEDKETEETEETEKKSHIQINLEKAKGHINRALLDCFKYSCLTLYDEYRMFMHVYRFVDLSSLDNGRFLKNLNDLKEAARIADRKARIEEGDSGDDIKVFRMYEKAFNHSVKLHQYISKHESFAAGLRRKLRIYNVLSALGWIVGVVSGLHALWEAYGEQIITFFTSL